MELRSRESTLWRSLCCILATAVVVLAAGPAHAKDAPGAAAYVEGMSALAQGHFDDAANALERAVAADDEQPDYHVGRAVALMLKGDEWGSKAHFDRLLKLAPRHEAAEVWRYAHIILFDPTNLDRQGPYHSKEPYARPLLDALTAHYGATARNDAAALRQATARIHAIAAEYAWGKLAEPKYAGSLRHELNRLYQAKQYAAAVILAQRLLAGDADNPALLATSAGSRLAIGDLQNARDEYTHAMRAAPASVYLFTGRALAAARMGALPTARADLAVALELGRDKAAPYEAQINKAIADAEQAIPDKASPAALLANARSAAATGSATLPALAEQLVRADAAERLVAVDLYTQWLARYLVRFDRNRTSIDHAVALAAYCINPIVTVPNRLDGNRSNVRLRVGGPDVQRAERAVNAALALNADHIPAIKQLALLREAQQRGGDMIKAVERAMQLGALDYDLARMYLDYYQSLAASLEAEAAALRAPKVHYEERADGRYRVTTYPSAANLARAAELEARAKQYRAQSMQPVRKLADAQPDTVDGRLAKAELHRVLGEYDKAVAAGYSALSLDRWSLTAREYLIDLLPKVGLMDKALAEQDTLDNLLEPSAAIALRPVWDTLEQTRYRSALEAVDQGEAKDPASPRVHAYRALIIRARDGSNTSALKANAFPAFDLALAMEHARLAVQGYNLAANVNAPIMAEHVGRLLSLSLAVALAKQVGELEAADAAVNTMLRLAYRVPITQWDNQLVSASLPTVFDRNADGRRTGITTRELVIRGHIQAGRIAAARKNDLLAAQHFVAAGRAHGNAEIKAETRDHAYPVYQRLGEARASQVFPQDWLNYFRGLDQSGRVKPIFSEPPAGRTKLEQLEARLRDIDRNIELLSRSQTMTAARNKAKLEKEREYVASQIKQLRASQNE